MPGAAAPAAFLLGAGGCWEDAPKGAVVLPGANAVGQVGRGNPRASQRRPGKLREPPLAQAPAVFFPYFFFKKNPKPFVGLFFGFFFFCCVVLPVLLSSWEWELRVGPGRGGGA